MQFIRDFRTSAPYVRAHRGRTFVIAFGGEAVADANFTHLVHDIALLHSLGVKLVLVHGARPQIEQRLSNRNAQMRIHQGLRVTDDMALECVKEASGSVRVEIEALLSMGIAHSPMGGARIRVAGSNAVIARPLGVRDGVDYGHTGEVRRVDHEALRSFLNEDAIVLISPLGYSPTGEIFNLAAEEIASAVAVALGADKLIGLVEGAGVMNDQDQLIATLTPREAQDLLAQSASRFPDDVARHLAAAWRACRAGVRRAHVLSRHIDGALLVELFTREGGGTLITAEPYEDLRSATIDDVGGILELITPLEGEGVLVRRSRERLEMEMGHFMVVERDGLIIACAALYPYPDEAVGELACLAVHPDYRHARRGDALLAALERTAKTTGLTRLFVLTTHTAHWFRERGFEPCKLDALPVARQALYNYQRNSKVFIKALS